MSATARRREARTEKLQEEETKRQWKKVEAERLRETRRRRQRRKKLGALGGHTSESDEEAEAKALAEEKAQLAASIKSKQEVLVSKTSRTHAHNTTPLLPTPKQQRAGVQLKIFNSGSVNIAPNLPGGKMNSREMEEGLPGMGFATSDHLKHMFAHSYGLPLNERDVKEAGLQALVSKMRGELDALYFARDKKEKALLALESKTTRYQMDEDHQHKTLRSGEELIQDHTARVQQVAEDVEDARALGAFYDDIIAHCHRNAAREVSHERQVELMIRKSRMQLREQQVGCYCGATVLLCCAAVFSAVQSSRWAKIMRVFRTWDTLQRLSCLNWALT